MRSGSLNDNEMEIYNNQVIFATFNENLDLKQK